ncbi:Purine permease [Actinidia chinensis var. chinensis]|uniref:Probable purine permease n=1 Tax=Actinidia chinensis var. chinensis TaxID=1590841 RepID=A0A2R6Q0A7_ACTCC|nr:Purine permease [Actinidia chinensis var. chinensis]
MEPDQTVNKKIKWPFLLFSAALLAVGNCGGPLIMRLYFLHGGDRVWLSSWLETGGWPINILPILFTYIRRRAIQGPAARPILMKPPVFLAAAVIGLLTGVDDYLYAYGVARLPISTSALILASHLGFTAVFAYLLVRQKFTPYSMNAVFLLTVGAAVLALHTSGDRPKGESNREYYIGLFMTLATAMLYGFVLPLVELTYKKAKQAITYTLVLEIQLVMCFFATVFCTIGMLINNDFKAIPREAREFGLGETKYYVVLVCSAIIWQCFFLGAIGVIFSASSLLCAILIASLLPVTEALAVVFYKEKYQAEKGVSLVLSLWGFVSYFYGELKPSKKTIKTQTTETEIPQSISIP